MDNELRKKLEEAQKEKEMPFIGGVPQIGMFPTCLHCYCGRGYWNGREHLVCCICGHRTLKNPVTY